MVGIITRGSAAGWATALAVSSVLPPPMATTASAPSSLATPATRSISCGEHSPLKSTTTEPEIPSSVPSVTSSATASLSSRGLREPSRSSSCASCRMAPRPWMYLPGAAKTAGSGVCSGSLVRLPFSVIYSQLLSRRSPEPPIVTARESAHPRSRERGSCRWWQVNSTPGVGVGQVWFRWILGVPPPVGDNAVEYARVAENSAVSSGYPQRFRVKYFSV